MERLMFGFRAQAQRFARDVEYAEADSTCTDQDIWTGLSTGTRLPAGLFENDSAALVNLTRSVRADKPVGAASVEFKTTLRQRLLTEQMSPAASPVRWRLVTDRLPLNTWGSLWSTRRRWIAAGVLGFALSGVGGTAMASESALPGQPLYPVKRTLEDVRVALAWDEHTRAKLYVEQVHERLEEAETLARKPGASNDPELQATVRDLINAAKKSSNQAQQSPPEQAAATRQELAQFLQEAAPRLDALKQTVKSQPALAISLDSLATLATASPTPTATNPGTGTPGDTPVGAPTTPSSATGTVPPTTPPTDTPGATGTVTTSVTSGTPTAPSTTEQPPVVPPSDPGTVQPSTPSTLGSPTTPVTASTLSGNPTSVPPPPGNDNPNLSGGGSTPAAGEL